MLRDSLYTTMSTCGLLIWLSIGANAMVGVYNLLGGITYLKSIMIGLPFDPIGVDPGDDGDLPAARACSWTGSRSCS